MITPIRTLKVNEIWERENDLLVSSEDIKELARNERAKAIDEFADKTIVMMPGHRQDIEQIAEQMKGGAK